MTIHVKQHYRTVNGKLVLVHEHDQKGNAAKRPAPQHHEAAVDDEFEKLFGGQESEAQAPAPEPDADAEFEKLFGGDVVDSEFDKLFGGDAAPESTPEEATNPLTVQAIAKQPDGSKLLFKDGAYVRKAGDKLAYAGPFNYKVKNAIKDQCPGSKWDKAAKEWLVPEEHAGALDAIMEEHWGAAYGYTVPDEAQAAVDAAEPVPTETADSGFQEGDHVPSDEVKVGMKFVGKKSGATITITSIEGNKLVYIKTADGVSHSTSSSKAFWDEEKNYKFTTGGSNTQERERGPKLGSHVDFGDIDVGMVFAHENGDQIVVVDNDSSPLWIQDQKGDLFELGSDTWSDFKNEWTLAGKGGENFTPKPLKPGLNVGDTKTVNGKTYVLNANHRWELVEGAQSTTDTKSKLEGLGTYWGENTATVNGISVQRSSEYLYRVMKNDENGKPLSKKVKDALAELHPSGYLKKKGYYLVRKEDLDKLSAIIDGKTAPKPKAAPKSKVTPLSVPDSFPYKQIGPQKGSNPGGLYEDAYGKKWYIKFPETEDHAKNELLAAKLYKLAGVDAPHLKLVKKDGKVGIASAFQEGLTNNGDAIKKGAPGAKEGFGADAWLANWDSAGLSFDNMPIDKDGKAVRIDVGGSLLYRAQGSPKGGAFGNTVPEIDTLRDAAKNANTAAIFGAMTDRELDKSVASVLAIPDDVIETACMKFGPGDDAAKKELAKKLIARKKYLAKRFPEADKIANPPAPDPTKLTVDPAKLPKIPDFSNWNGQGKGLSGNAKVNEVNQKAVQAIYDVALQGNLVALKSMQMEVVNKDSGEVSLKPAYEHPSQHVRAFFDEVVSYMDVIANPASTKAKQWDLEDVSDIRELSDAFAPHLYGVSIAKVPANERLGFWISLGNAADPQQFAPKEPKNVSSTLKAQGKQDYAKMPEVLKSWLGSVQSSGSNNQPYRDGSETDHQGRKTRDVLEAAYGHATEFPEGTTIRKWIDFPPAMLKQLNEAADGHVFQNPGSMCCSMSDSWEGGTGSGFGQHLLTIRYAKGARGLATYGSGGYSSEQEITTLPGQRFMILNKGKTKKGTLHLELLMLPPDKTYVDNIKPKAAAA